MKTLTKMREKGQLTLPSLFRKALGLKAGDYFEVKFQDNVIVLKPCKSIPKDIPEDEAWYWTKEWQEKEHRARRDIHEGRVKSFDNIDDFIKDLKDEIDADMVVTAVGVRPNVELARNAGLTIGGTGAIAVNEPR